MERWESIPTWAMLTASITDMSPSGESVPFWYLKVGLTCWERVGQ